jgi:hypothetical protein
MHFLLSGRATGTAYLIHDLVHLVMRKDHIDCLATVNELG